MEKKLTDEEIVKALDVCYNSPCCNADCPYFNKNGRNLCLENKAFYRDMKRIAEEYVKQKAEIERLTEENKAIRINCEKARNITGQMFDKNDELQKQVDELKANQVIECYGMLKGCDMVNQAVKDTAREILQMVECWEDRPYVSKDDFKESIKQLYGVEVE